MSEGRILVVDNEPQVRRVIRTTLTAAGFEVSDAREGQEAIDQMRHQKYDVVLLDINMSRLDGFETCRAIRKSSGIPIIMLTVRDGENDQVQALEAGADDYVTKPFSTPELVARIHATLRRSAPAQAQHPPVLRLDGIEVHLQEREVRSENGTEHLSPKEAELLCYLAAHADQVVSHRELLHAVWGPEYGEETEYLRTIILRLRKKIERVPSNPRYLLTHAWTGYRLKLSEISAE